MDLAALAGLGSLVTAALGAVGFFLAQVATLRKLIEAGDKAVREAEGRARHDIANRMQAADTEMRRDVEQLKREAFRRDEAREMEGRFTMTMARIEAKMDRQGEQIGEMLSLKGSLNACIEQVRELASRMAVLRP